MSQQPLNSCTCGLTGVLGCPVHATATLGTGSNPPEPYSLTGEVRPPDDDENDSPT